MAELKKYSSFEALKSEEKSDSVDRPRNNTFSEFEAFFKRVQKNSPIRKRPKHIMERSLVDDILSVCKTLNKCPKTSFFRY